MMTPEVQCAVMLIHYAFKKCSVLFIQKQKEEEYYHNSSYSTLSFMLIFTITICDLLNQTAASLPILRSCYKQLCVYKAHHMPEQVRRERTSMNVYNSLSTSTDVARVIKQVWQVFSVTCSCKLPSRYRCVYTPTICRIGKSSGAYQMT